MKIAITSVESQLESSIDSRFGRAAGFIIYDIKTDNFNYVNNSQNLNAMQGAGIQAAQTVVNENIDALITGHCGPKAFKVLSASGIKIYTNAKGTVKEIIEKFKNNELEQAFDADVEGHWV